MNLLFLQGAAIGIGSELGFFAGLLFVIIISMMITFIALYVYLGLAFMAIGKKVNLNTPALSWIPFVGPLIISFQASKMHWWPWLLLITFVIPFVNFIGMIVFAVYSIIWMWKTFETVGKPGWWAILFLIPVIGSLLFLILVGVAAWSK